MHRCFLIKSRKLFSVRSVIQLRGLLVQHHLIIDGDELHLIDGGFIGGISRIEKTLTKLGKKFTDLNSIILTHGHLDHSLNVGRLQKLSACPVYAPQLDQAHLQGRHLYRGLSRLCGGLEKIGQLLLRYKAPKVDHWFKAGDEIMGLKIIALPGHTIGHSGIFLAEEKLLIAGDLFTNHFGKMSPPPRAFNDDHREAQKSIRKAASMDLDGLYLNHARKLTPAQALRALVHLTDHL